jgi:hypothetical protein
MSRRVDCPDCGQPMDVPAFPGDGVYSTHHCSLDLLREQERLQRIADGEWTEDDFLPCEVVPWR